MKLQPDKSSAPQVRAYTQEWLQIDERRFNQSVLVSSLPSLPPREWEPLRFTELHARHLEALTTSGAELVIVGTGQQHRFLPGSWLEPFARQRIGLETMATAAACRTYNILAGEGRKVLAALLLEP